MNAEREHKHLAQADRYIAELKKDIARQWQIIEELSMGGQPLHEAISMLRLLKDHLRIMERHRQSILDELTSPWGGRSGTPRPGRDHATRTPAVRWTSTRGASG